jgi:5-methylcytosine-specific restriction endonuclease McrA
MKRSPIRSKRRVRRVYWRTGKVREDAKGMATLRSMAFHRSGGICECGREECLTQPMRLRRVTWADGQLHHVISRARGGSDVLSNVLFVTRECHAVLTGKLQWTRNFKPWDARY